MNEKNEEVERKIWNEDENEKWNKELKMIL